MWHVCGKEGRLGIWWGDLKKRDHINDLVLDRRIILEWILKTWEGRHGLSWADSWWLDVNAVMKFRAHKKSGISWIAEDLVASEEGLCSMELVVIPPLLHTHISFIYYRRYIILAIWRIVNWNTHRGHLDTTDVKYIIQVNRYICIHLFTYIYLPSKAGWNKISQILTAETSVHHATSANVKDSTNGIPSEFPSKYSLGRRLKL